MAAGFPEDENGDVLHRMQGNGDDLSIPRDIYFSVVFTSAKSAEEFASSVRQRGFGSVEESDSVPDMPWDVTVTKRMRPTHKAISEFEDMLGASPHPLVVAMMGGDALSTRSSTNL